MDTFLKWAGGNRWLINSQQLVLPDMKKINCYYEPFLGGGAMFFHLEPKTAYISDINEGLINYFITIKSLVQIRFRTDKRQLLHFTNHELQSVMNRHRNPLAILPGTKRYVIAVHILS